MKRTTIIFTIVIAAALLCGASLATAQEVEFNYNGRVKVQGNVFDGTGLFKFSLVNQNKQVTYWANDGVSLDGSEPTTHVIIAVTDGGPIHIDPSRLSGPAGTAAIDSRNRRICS